MTFHQTGSTVYPVSYLDKAVVYNSLECSPEMADSHQPVNIGHQDLKTKFKVVKVETTEPLKRGRWTCIDFTDKHTTPGPTNVTTSSGSDGSKNMTSVTSKPAAKSEVERHYSGGAGAADKEAGPETSSLVSKETERQVGQVVEPEFSEERHEEVTSSKDEESESEHALTVETDKAPVSSPPSDPVNSASSKSNLNSPGSLPESSKGKSLHISLTQQSVPVITATPHSPITAPAGPEVSNLQSTIGQVIRLNDGTLAQVALAPLPPQQQLGNVIPGGGPVLIPGGGGGHYMLPQAPPPVQSMGQIQAQQPPQSSQHQSQSNPQQSTIIQQSMKSLSSTNQQQNLVNYPTGTIQQQLSSIGSQMPSQHVPMQHQNTSMSAAGQMQQMMPAVPPGPPVSGSDSSGPGLPLSKMSQFPASVTSPTKRSSIISVSSNVHQSRPRPTTTSQVGSSVSLGAFTYIQGESDAGLVEKLELELGEQSREVDLGELDR